MPFRFSALECSDLERVVGASSHGRRLCYHSQMDDKTTKTFEGIFVALVLGIAMWLGGYVLWTSAW